MQAMLLIYFPLQIIRIIGGSLISGTLVLNSACNTRVDVYSKWHKDNVSLFTNRQFSFLGFFFIKMGV